MGFGEAFVSRTQIMLLSFAGRVIRGIDGEDRANGLSFFWREIAGEPRRIDDLLALIGRHLAKICDGMNHHASARDWGSMQLLDGVIPLLLLLRAEALQVLDSVQHPAALLRIHVV